ncbi:MAG: thermonuclease family protein [Candidatus Pacearchaeota archaeon]
MDKIKALFISLIITSLIAVNYIFFTTASTQREKVEILRVLDGDTVELTDDRKIRLVNINTPEKKFPYSELAKNYLSDFIGEEVYLEDLGPDKYGRTLGRIFYEGQYLNKEIILNGMAHKYLVIEGEEREFEDAEKSAIENEVGIWTKSENYGCILAEINKYEEYVVIEDSCGVNFNGWTVKDESTKSYKFANDITDRVILYSANGVNDANSLYWGKEKVWNDAGDSIFIRDASGLLVYYDSY